MLPYDGTTGGYQTPVVEFFPPGASASIPSDVIEDESEHVVLTKIEHLSERHEKQEKQALAQGELARLNRNLELADAVERLEAGDVVEAKETRMLSGALESRGWHNLFAKLESGDDLIVFLAPSGKQEGIKYMNDTLFGSQRTDRIIEYRRVLVQKALAQLGIVQLASNYKCEYCALPAEALREDAEGALERVAQELREAMTAFLVEEVFYAMEDADEKREPALRDFLHRLLGSAGAEAALVQSSTVQAMHRAYEADLRRGFAASAIAEEARDASETNVALRFAREYEDQARAQIMGIRSRIQHDIVAPALEDPHRGYRVLFGVSRVGPAEGEGSYTHIERAVSEATKGALRASEAETCGTAWSPEAVERQMAEWKTLRTELEEQYLVDEQGRTYPLFGKRGDGTVELNADVIRLMRKEAFIPREDQAALAQSVLRYTRMINVLDVLKPFVHEEFAGDAVHGGDRRIRDQLAWTNAHVQALRSGKGLDQAARSAIAEEIRKEGRDQACTSVMEFHQQALEIPECTYVHLDAIDVGVRLLQEFELLLQRVERGEMTFDQAQLVAGDATTKSMRAFRADVSRVYHETTGDARPIMLVGGDEVLLAMDRRKATDDLLLGLQSIRIEGQSGVSGVRVIKTAVAEAERTSFIPDQEDARDDLKREHLKAQKLTEAGSERAKEIEHGLRETTMLIASLPVEERDGYTASLRALNLDRIAIRQSGAEDAFKVVLREPGAEARVAYASCQTAMQRIHGLQTSIRERVSVLRAELLPLPGVTETNVTEALYRKHRLSPEGFSAWLQTQTV